MSHAEHDTERRRWMARAYEAEGAFAWRFALHLLRDRAAAERAVVEGFRSAEAERSTRSERIRLHVHRAVVRVAAEHGVDLGRWHGRRPGVGISAALPGTPGVPNVVHNPVAARPTS